MENRKINTETNTHGNKLPTRTNAFHQLFHQRQQPRTKNLHQPQSSKKGLEGTMNPCTLSDNKPVSLSKVAARLRQNVRFGVHQKRVNIKSAVVMAYTVTSCSTELLAAKSRSCAYSIAIFTSAFSVRFYEQMVAFVQGRSLELH